MVKNDTTRCIHCKEALHLGEEARAHYTNIHPEYGVHQMVVTISDLVRLSPNLTIKPLGEGMNLVVKSCGCGAYMCYNTAGCPISKGGNDRAKLGVGGATMTRSVTITNTSNWDGEDYIFPDPYGKIVRIRPGESNTFTPPADYALTFEEAEGKTPEPFMAPGEKSGKRADKQVMPHVRVVFESGEESVEDKADRAFKLAWGTAGEVHKMKQEHITFGTGKE